MPFGKLAVPPWVWTYGPYVGGFGHFNLPYPAGIFYPAFTFPFVASPPTAVG